MKHHANTIDLNTLLLGFNYILFAATLLFYSFVDLPAIFNNYSLIIYLFLVIQMHFFLYCEKRKRDPLILILAFLFSVFYFPRFITMFVSYNYGTDVLERMSSVTSGEINHALLFIFFANFFIFLGLAMPKNFSRKTHCQLQSNRGKSAPILIHPLIPVTLLGIIIMSGIYFVFFEGLGRVSGEATPSRFVSYASIFLNTYIVLFIVFTWLLFYKPDRLYEISCEKAIVRKYGAYVKIIIVLLLLFAITLIIIGSRSAVLAILLALLFCALAAGETSVKKKHLIYAVALLLATVFIFNFATHSRKLLRTHGTQVNISDYRNEMMDYRYVYESQFDVKTVIVPVLNRTAFLDYSVDLIRNSAAYGEIINFPFYAKSLVDSFTPGFDVFDVGKASNSLRYIYGGVPLYQKIESYNSDQFSVYGEYYVLFNGWFSLPVFFIVAFIFQTVYSPIRGRNLFNKLVIRAFIIYIFYTWLNSFGTDWIIIESTRMGVVLFVMLYAINYFSIKRVKRRLLVKQPV